MPKFLRTPLIVILAVWLFFQTVLVSPRQLDDQSNVEIYDRQHGKESYDQLAKGLHLVEVKGSEREWELWADQADKRAGLQDWDLTSVKAQFFGKDSLRYNVLGEEGSVAESQKDMEIVGDVRTTSSEGYRFNAGSLRYDSVDRVLVSPGEVVVFGPPNLSKGSSSFVMRGVGLKAHVEESLIRLKEDIRASVQEPGGPPVQITSDQATLKGETKTAVFEGHVVINYQDMVLRSPTATFYFTQSGSAGLNKVVLDGGVRLRDSLRRGESRRLTLYVQQERAEMEGEPRVHQGADVLQGEKIIFLDGGERVQVMRARAKVRNVEEREDP